MKQSLLHEKDEEEQEEQKVRKHRNTYFDGCIQYLALIDKTGLFTFLSCSSSLKIERIRVVELTGVVQNDVGFVLMMSASCGPFGVRHTVGSSPNHFSPI